MSFKVIWVKYATNVQIQFKTIARGVKFMVKEEILWQSSS